MSYSFVFNDTPQVLNLFSEWLCWCLIWAGIKIHSFISRKKSLRVQRDDVKGQSTCLAFFIVTSSVCASIVEVHWILPFVTPALYFVTRNNPVDEYFLPSNFKSKRSEYPANYACNLIFYLLVAISTTVLFLPSSANSVTIGLALIFLICQTAIYSHLTFSATTRDEAQSTHQLFLNLEGTCCWVVCFLTVILLVSQQQVPEIISLSIYSTFKALLWVSLIFLCNEGHACTLTLMSTFGLCTIYIPVFPSSILATLSCLSAILILAQIISSLPRESSTRHVIALFAIFPIAVLLFRFRLSETLEAFLEVFSGLFSENRCAKNANIMRNATDIAQSFMDEPSRLVAEFGPREETKSWLDVILRF